MGQGAQGEETSSGQKEGTEDRGGKHYTGSMMPTKKIMHDNVVT